MKINIGDYLIETDERQFIVKSKKVTEESRLTKEENIGKETWKAVAYCTAFSYALKFVPQRALKDNDDISVIKEKLEQIQADIKAIEELPVIAANVIEEKESITISKEEYESLSKANEKLIKLQNYVADNLDVMQEKKEGKEIEQINY